MLGPYVSVIGPKSSFLLKVVCGIPPTMPMPWASYIPFFKVESSLIGCFSGGMYSAQIFHISTPINIRFVNNSAVVDAGAMFVTDPVEFNLSGLTFTSNEAVSGGAVKFESSDASNGEINECLFDNNSALLGAGMYLSPGEGRVSVHNSTFSYNIAGENPQIALNSAEKGGLYLLERIVHGDTPCPPV